MRSCMTHWTHLLGGGRQGKEDVGEHDHEPLRTQYHVAPEYRVAVLRAPVVHDDPEVVTELEQGVELRPLCDALCHCHCLQLQGERSLQTWVQLSNINWVLLGFQIINFKITLCLLKYLQF